LKYIYNKYEITPPWVLAQEEYQRSLEAEKASTGGVQSAEAEAGANEDEERDEFDTTQEAEREDVNVIESSEPKATENDAEAAENQSVAQLDISSPSKAQNREGRTNSITTGTSSNSNLSNRRNMSRSVSPPSGKSHTASWKMPVEEELQYR
jgi:hypothetical protein